MTVMELPRIDDMLRDVLAAAPAVVTAFGTRIYGSTMVQPTTPYPFLLYYPQVAADDEVLSGTGERIGVTTWYFVGGETWLADYQTVLAPAMDAVDAALSTLRTTPAVAGGYRLLVMGSRDPVRLDDMPPNSTKLFRRLGRSWQLSFEAV